VNHSVKVIKLTPAQDIIIPNITINNATAVPSLKRLSHSNNKANLLGAQRVWKIAKTATGSVADIITQKSNVTKKGICIPNNPKIKYNHPQIIKDEIVIQTTANNQIALQS